MYRIQRKRTKGWKMPEDAKYIGRRTKWGNPFKVGGKLGDVPATVVKGAGYWWKEPDTEICPQMAKDLYREWLPRQANLMTELKQLKHYDALACWCALDKPCHADVIIELLKEIE